MCFIIIAEAFTNIIDQISADLVHIRPQPQVGCNGHPELCDRKYSNITQIGAHDSAFVGAFPMDNQNVDVSAQLDAGIRFLQAQTHRNAFGVLSLCHTSCFIKDAGSVQDYLSTINDWLGKHPQEVVTLLLTNGDHVNVSEFDKAYTLSGLRSYAYIPTATHDESILDSWPTLGELISSGKRLVAFLDTGASQDVPYILNEFSYFWETPFDTTDPSFLQCTIDRPGHLYQFPAVAKETMYISNHFLDTDVAGMEIPDRRDAARTNAVVGKGSIGAQVDLCRTLHGRPPVGVLVDYFDKGEVFRMQDLLNGF